MLDTAPDSIARRFRAARPFHADVDRWANQDPDRLAVAWSRDPVGGVTYGRLSAWSSQIAAQLSHEGIGEGDRVVLDLAPGPEAVAAMLAVSRAGAVCVALDRAAGLCRSRQLIDIVKARIVLTEPERTWWALGLLTAGGPVAVGTLGTPEAPDDRLSFTGLDIGFQDPLWRGPAVGSDDLARITFVSAPDGRARGVMTTHRSLIASADWAVSRFGYCANDRVSAEAPLHVDLSSFDIGAAMAAGATLCPVGPAASREPADLLRFVRDSRLTQWFTEPAVLDAVVGSGALEDIDLPDLQRLVWRGRPLSPAAQAELVRRLPHVEVTMLYGSAETTIVSSGPPPVGLDWSEDLAGPIPLGTPCEGVQLVVLGPDGQTVPDGVIGEIHVGGAALSPGYWRDPEATDAAFTRHADLAERLYATGDLGLRQVDGSLFVLGSPLGTVVERPWDTDPNPARSARSSG